MSDEKLCANCKFFARIAPKDPELTDGYCHRYPTLPHVNDDGELAWYWPEVAAYDWCGEFKEQEK